MGISFTLTVLYFFAIAYVVYKSTFNQKNDSIVKFIQNTADIIGSISSNNVAFIFAIMMNFVLLFGFHCINMGSVLLADMARVIEQRRTGGRR